MIYFFEKHGPLAASVVSAAVLMYFSKQMIDLAAQKQIDFSALYASMFNWASIQTGFVFGVFGFVSGKSSGFLADVNRTKAMRDFNAYTMTAIVLGFVLTFSCIPLIVSGFEFSKSAAHYYVFVAWAFFAMWSFLAFARVAYVFGVILKVGDKEKIVG